MPYFVGSNFAKTPKNPIRQQLKRYRSCVCLISRNCKLKMTNRKPKSTILLYSDDCEQIAYTGFTRFRLPLACRARSSMSMYLSVIALELCPALSRTCSLGQCSTSSEIPVCRSQCTVASESASASFRSDVFIGNCTRTMPRIIPHVFSWPMLHILRNTCMPEPMHRRLRERLRFVLKAIGFKLCFGPVKTVLDNHPNLAG